MNRIDARFQKLKAANSAAFVGFITAGDPDAAMSLEIMKGLPNAGVDIIELGMPFTDPMADGPAIQAANLRALAKGATLAKTLDMAKAFRAGDSETPVVLMGYYNPIYSYGVDKFVKAASAAGIDGLIVVDLPPEEDAELRLPAQEAGMHIIRLATPTTHKQRLGQVLQNSGGFIYYVSVTGITGAAAANSEAVNKAVKAIQAETQLPVAVGFGIRDEQSAAAIAQTADAVVVGSAIVARIAENAGKSTAEAVKDVCSFVGKLSNAAHNARKSKAA